MGIRGQPELNLPETSGGPPLGGVILFTQTGKRDGKRLARGQTGGAELLGRALQTAGLAVLRIQISPVPRARGKVKSNHQALEKPVMSAVERLSAACGNNGHRLALVAERRIADRVLVGARTAWQMRSFVLLSARLGQQAKDLLIEWQSNPTLCLVSSEDKAALRDMTDVYFSSKQPRSDIQVFEGLGRGFELIEDWKKQFPEREALELAVANWLYRELRSAGQAREVSFLTEDGWSIYGNLLVPDRNGKKAPGVVLLHSGRSDRYVFTDLERLLLRAGFAVLNIDWRGRGKSINKGKYFDLSREERANGKLDCRAAIDFLSSQIEVDRERIGIVGIIHGAEHAVRGSIGDPRVKALALLHGYIPSDQKERDHVTSGQVHVMYVSSKAHKQVTETMRQLYQETPDKLTRFLVFEGGAIGYQLFELDDRFQPAIVEWLKEVLAP